MHWSFYYLVLVLFLLSAPSLLLLPAEAKKEKPLSPAFPPAVVIALHCDVCGFLMKSAYKSVTPLFEISAQTRVRVSEEEVLTALEEICLPLSEAGRWIRRLAIDTAGAPEPFLRVSELPVDCKCKRTCSTVAEACEALMDEESMDSVPALLLHPDRFSSADEFAQTVCDASPLCNPRRGLPPADYEQLRAMIKADVPEEIDAKEMELERMMDQMERKDNRRSDVFSREEILEMQRGFAEGNRESIGKVDPKIHDLNNEEFEDLRRLVERRRSMRDMPDDAFGDGVDENTDEDADL